jgi:hypothetical protein
MREGTRSNARHGLAPVLAALVLCLAPGVAPAAAPPSLSGERLVLFRQLYTLVGQYRALAPARPPCPAAKGRVALLRRATTGAARASASSLRTRTVLLGRAVRARQATLSRCAGGSNGAVPGVAARIPTPPPAQGPGTGKSGPVIVPISLANIVHGDALDLTSVLGDARLPAALQPLQLQALNDRACRGVASICLGLDRPLLDAQLEELMNRNALGLALGNVGTLNLSGLLTQVDTLLGGDSASGLIAVERVDDRHLRLRPLGPLAELATVPDVPQVAVGQIEIAGVIGCPPAVAGGLPRACVS